MYNRRAQLIISVPPAGGTCATIKQYAISAFEQPAVDYLLKPPDPERVALTCQRSRDSLKHVPDPMNDLWALLSQRLVAGGAKPREYIRWMQASVGANIRMIPTSDILFFRAGAEVREQAVASG